MRISDWSSDVCSSDLSELVEDEPVGGRDCVAVDQRLGQVGRGAAQRHALALAELAIDDDAGYALKRLGDILVRKFADIFRADDVGDHIRIALGLDRLAERTANTGDDDRSEEHTSELQSLMRNSYAVFCLKKKKHITSIQKH